MMCLFTENLSQRSATGRVYSTFLCTGTCDGRKRMKASAYREWCEKNGRDSSEAVRFNTKNGPILRIAEYYQQAKIVEWAKVA